jgi:prolyl-tRNA synthetase
MQSSLLDKARKRTEDNTYTVDSWEDFVDAVKNRGGFIKAHWDGTTETEQRIKEKTKATIRCIELDAPTEEGVCVYSGKPSKRRVVFAKAY